MPERCSFCSLVNPSGLIPRKFCRCSKQGVPELCESALENLLQRNSLLRFAPAQPGAPAFWQRRFYDFNVWSEKKLKEKLDYMHRNPVERKLVLHPQDWALEQLVAFIEKRETGLIRIDALGTEEASPVETATSKNRTLEGTRVRHQSYLVRFDFGQ